jgi:hypothetical protein
MFYSIQIALLKILILEIRIDAFKLIEGADIVRYIKAQRIKWLGHIQRVDQARPTRKLFEWKPMGPRPVGRSRERWQETVMEDLKKVESKKTGRKQLRIEEFGVTWLGR